MYVVPLNWVLIFDTVSAWTQLIDDLKALLSLMAISFSVWDVSWIRLPEESYQSKVIVMILIFDFATTVTVTSINPWELP